MRAHRTTWVGLCLVASLLACDTGGAAATDADVAGPPGKADDPDALPFEGVLADFAPSRGVSVHVLLRDLAPAFLASLEGELGDRVVRNTTGYTGPSGGYSRDSSVVWTRDYYPAVVQTATEKIMVPYLSINATRSGFSGAQWIPVTPPSAEHDYYRTPPGNAGEWRVTTPLSLLHENGNLVSTGDWLIVTDKLLRLNTAPSEGSDGAHLQTAGWKVRSEDEVLDAFSAAMRTARERIIVFPSMPGEKTDHADLFVMALGPSEVLVPEIRDDILEIITYGHEIELAWRVREFLDDVATVLEDKGLTVHRLPMLPPVFLLDDADELTGYNGVFYTPTNATQVHIAGERARIWLPSFTPTGFPAPYIAVASAYEASWREFFEARDMSVFSVDASELGLAYGIFRCVTFPIF